MDMTVEERKDVLKRRGFCDEFKAYVTVYSDGFATLHMFNKHGFSVCEAQCEHISGCYFEEVIMYALSFADNVDIAYVYQPYVDEVDY